MYTLSNPGTCP